jgi:anti-sigma B factor antagonist
MNNGEDRFPGAAGAPEITVAQEDHDGGVTVLAITGDLDVATGPQLRDRLIQVMDEGRYRLVLDLTGVPLLDSLGLGVIVGVVHRLRPHDGALALACARPAVTRALKISGLTSVLAVHDTLDEAVAAVRAGHAQAAAAPRITTEPPEPGMTAG